MWACRGRFRPGRPRRPLAQELNAHVNAFDVDAVVDSLRAALRDEAAVLLADADFLRECIAGEHAFRSVGGHFGRP